MLMKSESYVPSWQSGSGVVISVPNKRLPDWLRVSMAYLQCPSLRTNLGILFLSRITAVFGSAYPSGFKKDISDFGADQIYILFLFKDSLGPAAAAKICRYQCDSCAKLAC